MCSGLHGNKTSRYLLKYLFHRFRCRRHFLFQKNFARFIQNAVARPAIAEVHTNRELVSFENHVSIYPNSANLFHCRSPFHCASSTSNIGSVSHPAGDRPSHLILLTRLPKKWNRFENSRRQVHGSCACPPLRSINCCTGSTTISSKLAFAVLARSTSARCCVLHSLARVRIYRDNRARLGPLLPG